ncbi:MAG: VWA-like domain-containing protein [Paracoccaceae bacterium]|nr:VWA-like domain-containing protein [Paracoccaceae bacterium]
MRGHHSARAGPALRALAETDPALAALSFWCAHRDGPGPIARTAGDAIVYGPGFPALPRREQIGVAAHHILHVAFRHGARSRAMASRLGPGFDPQLFNIAADAILNETLIAAGYSLPRPRVTLTALLEEAPGRRPPSTDALSQWDVERLYLHLAAGNGTGTGRAGEAAKSLARDAGFEDDLGAGPPDTETGAAADWAGLVSRAIAEGRAAGRGLGRLAGRLGDLPKSEVPWERRFRTLVTRAVTRDTLPQPFRPSRRWLAMDAAAAIAGAPRPGFLAASGRPRSRARIAVMLDASGSVPARVRDRFAGEVAGIATRTGAEVHLIVFDAEVRESRRLPDHEARRILAELNWPEGGGTDFAPAFAEARAADPSVIVVLTDLEAEIGTPPARCPVLWAIPGAVRSPPPWGRVISLDR